MSANFIVLAAGMSSRMMPLTRHLPKSLLPIGQTTLLQRLIDQFNCRCKKTTVIAGYHSDLVSTSVPNDIDVIKYADYQLTNNFFTLKYCASHFEPGALISFSDIFLSDKAVTIIEPFLNRDRSFMVVDTSKVLESTMGVIVEGGEVAEICLDSNKFRARGNFVGVAHISRSDWPAFVGSLNQLSPPEDSYYTAAIQDLIDGGRSIKAVDIAGAFWAEIDTPSEYDALLSDLRDLK